MLKIQTTNSVGEAVENAVRVAGDDDLGDTAKTSESKRIPGGQNGYDDDIGDDGYDDDSGDDGYDDDSGNNGQNDDSGDDGDCGDGDDS